MTLNEKSTGILELPQVLELLAAEAVSEGAKELARGLKPETDLYVVQDSLAETTDAKNRMSVGGSPGFSGIRAVSGALARADMGGSLSPKELLEIACVLRAARGAIAYADGDNAGTGAVDGLFSSLSANKYLEEKITSSILGEEEIADAASTELADIRRHMRAAGERVRQSLQKVISSPAYAKALQEPIITMRNDRYVVPVRAEFKSSVPGLVHDVSASGATFFIEPISSVEANNEIRELLAKEKKEIERILAELSAEAAADREDIDRDYQVLTQLDLIFAKAKLSYRMDASEPVLSENGKIALRKARHPLLPKKTAVPIDVRLGEEFNTLVITGPNTGGKTVSLKTVGLLCLMAACGLHIPAGDGSSVPVFAKVLADIGDEQSIEQSLSTFSSHMTNIVHILEECGENTLLLFDELGAGTDPTEGAALAISIIEFARKKGAEIVATTHYSELKVYATSSEGVQNACCEFDVETLRPTYRLLIGIPGKSNAFAISGRLGLSEEIIDDARSRLDSGSAELENVLESLECTRQGMEKERLETRKLLRQAEEDGKKSGKYRQELEKEREKATGLARREAEQIISAARAEAESVLEEAREIRKNADGGGDWQKLNEAGAKLRHRLNEAEDAAAAAGRKAAPEKSSRPARAGDVVELRGIGTKASVISAAPDGTLTLQAGIMKITAKQNEVAVLENAEAPKTLIRFRAQAGAELKNLAVKAELDLRGMMTDEAIPVLERYLDSAVMAKLNSVTVIHGKGTGAMRAAVQRNLKKNRLVKSFRLGTYGEGDAGVTVVELK